MQGPATARQFPRHHFVWASMHEGETPECVRPMHLHITPEFGNERADYILAQRGVRL